MQEKEINLIELFEIIKINKKIILSITLLVAFLSAILSLLQNNVYTSEAIITLSEETIGSNVLTNNSNESLGFISIGKKDPRLEQGIIVLSSWKFVESFVDSEELGPYIIAMEGWNPETNEIIFDEDIYNSEENKWLIEDEDGNYISPSSWDYYKAFLKHISFYHDKEDNMLRISVTSVSPEFSRDMVSKSVAYLNSHMKEKRLSQINTNITYLEQEISKTSVTSIKANIFRIIEEQVREKMLTEASKEYIFTTVSPAMVAQEKSGPSRLYTVVLFTLFSLIISSLYFISLHYLRGTKEFN